MKEFEGLINLGRSFGTTRAQRGPVIQLEGDTAYIMNTHHSIIYELTFNGKIGTGTFYASEAPINSEKIERRENKVLFEWKERNRTKRIFVPDKSPFITDAKKSLE
ncbi:unnamed protein product, partial [marine sediment metagenome]